DLGAFVAEPAGRDAVGVIDARSRKRPIAPERSAQRAHGAGEFKFFEGQPRAAGGIGQAHAAVVDIETVDRQGLAGEYCRALIDLAEAVESDAQLRRFEPHLDRAQFAAHQWTE